MITTLYYLKFNFQKTLIFKNFFSTAVTAVCSLLSLILTGLMML